MLFGIDTADDENKKANWALAKAQGPISFAIVRASFGTVADATFGKTWPVLGDLGITRGAYLFLRFPTKGGKKPPDPGTQARAFIDTVGELAPSDFPPSLDVEFGAGRAATGLSAAEALDWVRAAWVVLRDHYGTPPIIYTSARVWREDLANLPAPDLVESPLWLVGWPWKERTPARRGVASLFAGGSYDPRIPPTWGSAWAIHQYQGDALEYPGFAFTVDCNRFNTMLQGASGDTVKWAQRRLSIPQTGKFDGAMTTAVQKFQNARGLVRDGIIGPKTFAHLCWVQ